MSEPSYEDRLQLLERSGAVELLAGIGRGIEKESLRVTPDGRVAQTRHPHALGASLTSPTITTDFSEALLEFCTPVFHSVSEMLECQRELHVFTHRRLGEEMMWATSMPCLIGDPSSIPIAEYGDSNIGRMKHVYRKGLDARYGRPMQAIAGMHYNFSMPESFWPEWGSILGRERNGQDFISEMYMGAIRNCLRNHALILYLLGASPAVCRSFSPDFGISLDEFDADTLYRPVGTTLRLSEIGYQNDAQSGLQVSLNTLPEYVRDLDAAVATSHPPYEQIGVQVNGDYRQLSSSMLQVENEYYGWARPKRTTRRGERVTSALRERGVQYIEIRSLDVNPYHPIGIDETAARFLDTYILYSIISPSPPMSREEEIALAKFHLTVVHTGRDPELTVVGRRDGEQFREWMRRHLDNMEPLATFLDTCQRDGGYADAIQDYSDVIGDVERTPSARIITDMRNAGSGFFDFAMQRTKANAELYGSMPLSSAREDYHQQVADDSHRRQIEIEAADELPFDEFLRQYYLGGSS